MSDPHGVFVLKGGEMGKFYALFYRNKIVTISKDKKTLIELRASLSEKERDETFIAEKEVSDGKKDQHISD